MAHPQLVVLGYSEAAMYLRSTPQAIVAAIISIHGPREFGIEAESQHRIDLFFDDVDVAAPGDAMAAERVWSRRRWAEQNGLMEVAPTSSDAASIIKFAKSIRDVDGIVLCHCGAGVSRAPAAALICLAVWKGPGAEAACVEEVLTLRHCAVPHAGLVRLADELLDRKGELVRALAAALPK